MTVPKRKIRLVAEQFNDIRNLTGERGEVIYDVTNSTLRFNDGSTLGGIPLATQSWVSASGSSSPTIIDGGSATG
jgi:hypothetical protein